MKRRSAPKIMTRRRKGIRKRIIRSGKREDNYGKDRKSYTEKEKRRGGEDHKEVKRQGEARRKSR